MVVEGEEETTTWEMDKEELLVVVAGKSDVVLSWWRCWHWSIEEGATVSMVIEGRQFFSFWRGCH
jgi:hypothetical protein